MQRKNTLIGSEPRMDQIDIILDYHLIRVSDKQGGTYVFFKDYEDFRKDLKKYLKSR